MPRESRFWWLHAVLPLTAFAVAALVFEWTDLDVAMSDPFYDNAAGRWPARGTWWAGPFLHTGGRLLIVGVAAFDLAFIVVATFAARLRPWRRRAVYLFLAMLVSTGLVGLAKAGSVRFCPWDVERYGGSAPHLGLFEPLPDGLSPGRCFPGGHAAGGFSLLALYFVFRDRRRRAAFVGLGVGLGLGAAYGFGQVARGAHFVSHNLWSAAVCWTVALLLYAVVLRRAARDDRDPVTISPPRREPGVGDREK